MVMYYPTSKNFVQKTLGAQLDAGTTSSMTLNNVTGIQNKPGIVLIDRVTPGGVENPAASREFVAYTAVSGSTLTGLTRNSDGGSSDQDHAIGNVVEFVSDVQQQQALIDAIVAEHSTLGVHDATKVAMLAGTQTVTGSKTFSAATTISAVLTTSAGIKNTPRVVTTTDDATAVIDTDVTDQYQLTAVANATVFTVTGTPVAGQKLIVRFKDAGVAKGLTWTGFTSKGATLPTTTVASKEHYVGLIYNATASTWDCVAATVEA